MQMHGIGKVLVPWLLLATLAQAQSNTLKSAADKVGLNFGFAIGRQISNQDQPAMELIQKHANILVNENYMKFETVEPDRGKFNFTKPDSLVKFAEANGIRMRGHTLLWDYQIGWAGSLKSGRADVLNAIKMHIDSVVGYYKGRILEWDVVNEPLKMPKDSFTLRTENPWMNNVGADYIDSALVWAHRADPAAKLFINDFWIEWGNPKSDAMFALVKRLKEKNIPIHGVGFQSHTGNGQSKAAWSQNIKRFGDLGLLVSLTEVDVGSAGNTSEGWKAIFGACLENANCVSFVTWGLDDSQSWRNKAENNFNCDCLLFDKNKKAKPHVEALISAMNAANPAITAARKALNASTGFGHIQKADQSQPRLFSGKNELKYSLQKSGPVKLDVFNLDGLKVVTLVDGNESQGEHSITWSENHFVPGVYLFNLHVNGQQITTKKVVQP